ncbi:MAG TPA: carbon-nitrogen hydrolase family protein [Actinomycetales bacterium]|nr:carbon-nitrogen hydrolase family protein [Actinomycetales bacterium]
MTSDGMPRSPLKVAAAQLESAPGDLDANVAAAAGSVTEASARDVRVVVLPELFLPGYHPPTWAGDQTCDVVADEDGNVHDVRLDPLRQSASRVSAVVVGAAVRADGRRYLSSLVVWPDGRVVEAYRKQFLCGPHEHEAFTAGERGGAIEVDGWRLALAICYDGCFPEHARAAAVDGAHAYLCSAAYLAGSDHRRDLYYRARALENGMFVAMADAVGGPAPWTFGGGSAVYDPEGRPLAQAEGGRPGLVVADLDPTLLATTRSEHPMLADLLASRGS